MDTNGKQQSLVKKYSPLATAAGVGSMLGSGCIVGLSATIPVWKKRVELICGTSWINLWCTNLCNCVRLFVCRTNYKNLRPDSSVQLDQFVLCYWSSNLCIFRKFCGFIIRSHCHGDCIWGGFTNQFNRCLS